MGPTSEARHSGSVVLARYSSIAEQLMGARCPGEEGRQVCSQAAGCYWGVMRKEYNGSGFEEG